jgi:hypothetical protein
VTEGACDNTVMGLATMQTTKPANESEEVLHGLSPSEALRPIDKPRAAPVYR